MSKIYLVLNAVKKYMLYSLDPVKALTDDREQRWYCHLLLPAFGWMMFFLLVGLYRNFQSGYPVWETVFLAGKGFVLGYICVMIASILLSFMLMLFGVFIKVDSVITCVALSHTYMAFSMILGLVYFIFMKGTPTTFGITGLLCTLMPIYSGIRKLAGKNPFTAPIVASVIGVLMLAGWRLVLTINL